jgi:hypothetical protein
MIHIVARRRFVRIFRKHIFCGGPFTLCVLAYWDLVCIYISSASTLEFVCFMGNIISPQHQTKNVKLKGIMVVLKHQQAKIKNHRRHCMNKISNITRRMKHYLLQQKHCDHENMIMAENIRECAEEIFHEKKKLNDLKSCYDILSCLQYKVQNIMDAYYTHTTIQNVNNSIRDSNMNIQNEIQFDTGQSVPFPTLCCQTFALNTLV